jgi:beta-lactamase superfamily II metal-dependent hydrolase
MMPQNTDVMIAPDKGITVRMYHIGQGDCFLLAFKGESGATKYMVIDCGVYHTYKGCSDNAKKVAKDIKKATKGNIDYLVVTHQHTDHVYGFKYAREIFEDKITIQNLWLAWTEDETDSVAIELEDKYGKEKKALTQIARRLEIYEKDRALREQTRESALKDLEDIAVKNKDQEESVRRFKDQEEIVRKLKEYKDPLILKFNLMPAADPEEELGVGNTGTSDQIKFLKSRVETKLESSEHYRKPEDPPIEIREESPIRAYVLGPPRNLSYYETKKSSHTLHYLQSLSSTVLAALDSPEVSPEDVISYKKSKPFEKEYEIPENEAENIPFFQGLYGFGDHKFSWRRIDNDWLEALLGIALDSGHRINNTSLVIALELDLDGQSKVLLFVGDAEMENWDSWKCLSWRKDDGSKVTVPDLLKKTVLLKVGHHGSINATKIKGGLDQMTSSELVAMIPVDQQWAYSRSTPWKHPSCEVYEKLYEKTNGRIIQSDKIPEKKEDFEQPDSISNEDWKKYIGNINISRDKIDEEKKLWIEYTII